MMPQFPATLDKLRKAPNIPEPGTLNSLNTDLHIPSSSRIVTSSNKASTTHEDVILVLGLRDSSQQRSLGLVFYLGHHLPGIDSL